MSSCNISRYYRKRNVFNFICERQLPVWTASSEFGTYRLCEQRRFRRACASAQSRQNLRCSLIQAVSQRGTFRQKARSLAPLNGWACAVKICHDGMLEDTNSLDSAQMYLNSSVREKFRSGLLKHYNCYVCQGCHFLPPFL